MGEHANSAEQLPTPVQLRHLAMIGVRSAQERQVLRRRMQVDEFYVTDRLDAVAVGDSENDLNALRQTLGMRLGREVLTRFWQLQYYSGYHVQQSSDQWTRAVSVYNFAWDEAGVRRAHREVRLTDSGEEVAHLPALADVFDRLTVRDDATSMVMLGAQDSFEQVSRGDCEQLIEDVRAYYRQIESLSR